MLALIEEAPPSATRAAEVRLSHTKGLTKCPESDAINA